MANASSSAGPTRRPKQHYSFDDDRLEDIGRENMALLSSLARIATKESELAQDLKKKPAVLKQTSSFAINRRKQAAEIEKQNMMLLKKLQTAKPTVQKMMNKSVPRPGGRPGPALPPAPIRREAPVDATAARPEWDSGLGSGPAPRSSSGMLARGGAGGPSSMSRSSIGGSGSGGGGRSAMTSSGRDLRHVAMEACREDYLLK